MTYQRFRLDTETLIIVCTSTQPKEVSVPSGKSGMQENTDRNPFYFLSYFEKYSDFSCLTD